MKLDKNISERNQIISFKVSNHEREIIKEKAKISKLKSVSEYLRKISITGRIIYYDNDNIRQLNRHLSGIHSSINQIARRVNSTDRVYKDDLEYIKKAMFEVWKEEEKITALLRAILDGSVIKQNGNIKYTSDTDNTEFSD